MGSAVEPGSTQCVGQKARCVRVIGAQLKDATKLAFGTRQVVLTSRKLKYYS